MSILSFVLYLLVATGCSYLAQKLVPNSIPGGFRVSVLLGVLGAWIGTATLGSYGPVVYGTYVVPCLLGSIILVFAVSLAYRTTHKSS